MSIYSIPDFHQLLIGPFHEQALTSVPTWKNNFLRSYCDFLTQKNRLLDECLGNSAEDNIAQGTVAQEIVAQDEVTQESLNTKVATVLNTTLLKTTLPKMRLVKSQYDGGNGAEQNIAQHTCALCN